MSQRDSGYERKERDLYETPEWVTRALCEYLDSVGYGLGCVWEPAAGSGKMLDVLKLYADPGCAVGSDVHPLRDGIAQVNFLNEPPPLFKGPFDQDEFGAIITNPPYEYAQEFIEMAIGYFDPIAGNDSSYNLVAMLLRTDFDHAKSRAHLFKFCPFFHCKLVLTKRIKWFEDSKGQPSFNHAWYIWKRKHEGAPKLAYAP